MVPCQERHILKKVEMERLSLFTKGISEGQECNQTACVGLTQTLYLVQSTIMASNTLAYKDYDTAK